MTTIQERLIRLPARGVPHTREIDMLIAEYDLEAFSGHVPIALRALTHVYSPMEDEQRIRLWGITFDLMQEIANDEGWLYDSEYLVRDDYDFFADESGEVLQEMTASANRTVDRIWRLKHFIQETGVLMWNNKCETLAGDDKQAIAKVRKELHDHLILMHP